MKYRTLLTALLLATGMRAHAGITPAPTAEWLAGVSGTNVLVMFPSDDPFDVTKVKIKGLQKREKILAIDIRPFNGQLYALGSTSRLYTINWETGAATQVGTGPFTTLLNGRFFAFDFNPTVDRIRVMSDTGQNLRLHPDTAAVAGIDASLAYVADDPNFAAVPNVTACAYTNNDNDPETGTTLYSIDTNLDILVRQDNPNAGGLATQGPLGVDATEVSSFDIAGSNGVAYAAMVVKERGRKKFRATLYSIDLVTGAATSHGNIGGPWPLRSLTALGPATILAD
ncbi:DUF4394 domain-containing protein [Luteolibacter flavescens]|uniref:DUF4394 domain-containing protein n=1 Tax=Luteolibacter flavescens TaxID=1859460 RepID=A0ABT3FP90_9BACT|nr:DUF4394 domain-containing protein [Luteolibacter flavescens]MCW1885390.1 DUF4394 domain-containing protein [Luteolibacter flavescens]